MEQKSEKQMGIYEALNAIQTNLIAPKDKKNSFGNYNYRNLEAILQAVKPILRTTGCAITFTDDIVPIVDRIFCKSTATLHTSAGESISSVAFAELDAHKGMSKEQSTGSSSSYARKYAVCSLLAIDDNTDVDSLDNTDKTPVSTASSTKRSNVSAAPVKGAEKPKYTITMQDFDNGRCKAIVAKMMNYDPDDFPAWNKGLNELEEKYNLALGVADAIEKEVRMQKMNVSASA